MLDARKELVGKGDHGGDVGMKDFEVDAVTKGTDKVKNKTKEVTKVKVED